VKKGERAGKFDCWTRMPVHPESEMRGEDRACEERHAGDTDNSEAQCAGVWVGVEQSKLKEKTWGVVSGKPKLSRGKGGKGRGSSSSSPSESEDSDWRLENGLGEAKRDQSDGSKGAMGIDGGVWWGIRGRDHETDLLRCFGAVLVCVDAVAWRRGSGPAGEETSTTDTRGTEIAGKTHCIQDTSGTNEGNSDIRQDCSAALARERRFSPRIANE
jgi:hypothetical protein